MGKFKKISETMKTTQKLLLGIVGVLAISCSGGPDKMLTEIYPDGSCRRTFIAYANSSFMTGSTTEENNPFSVEIDSTYFIAWQYKGGEIRTDFPILQSTYDSLILTDTTSKIPSIDDFLVFASRSYKSVEEMSKIFKLKSFSLWNEKTVNYDFEKKFRFFYTYFTYKETYPKTIIAVFKFPIENYMNEEEIGFWFTGKPDLVQGMNGFEMEEFTSALKKKYDNWLFYNLWDSHYKNIINHYKSLKNQPISREELIRLQDTIYEKYSEKEDLFFETDKYLNLFFNTTAFSGLQQIILDSPTTYNKDSVENRPFLSGGHGYTYQLIMPGEIIYSNGVNRNDTLTWNLTELRMIPNDFTIEAQSRKLNVWMLVFTGMLAIAAIVIFVYRRKIR